LIKKEIESKIHQNTKTAGKTTNTKPVLFPAAIRHLFIFQFPVHQVLKNSIKTPFTPELHNPGTMKRHQHLDILNKEIGNFSYLPNHFIQPYLILRLQYIFRLRYLDVV